jgi:hypothetical protein
VSGGGGGGEGGIADRSRGWPRVICQKARIHGERRFGFYHRNPFVPLPMKAAALSRPL